MSEFGIPVPDTVRSWAIGKTLYMTDIDTGKTKAGKSRRPLELINAVDNLSHKARSILRPFFQSYTQSADDENHQLVQGWSMVREYTFTGTGFYYRQEPIAKDSIIVRHRIKVFPEGEESPQETLYYWISGRTEPKSQLPFIYVSQTFETEKNVVLDIDLFRHDVDNPRVAHQKADEIFQTGPFPNPDQYGYTDRYEISVYKQGKSMGEKAKKKKREFVPVIQRKLVPIPAPT